MLVAVPAFQDRVAPALDFCQRITLWRVDERGCRLVARRKCPLMEPGEKASKLQALGAELLLCGAIGRPLEEELAARGIDIRSGLSGKVAEVVAALACGALDEPRYQMPGATALNHNAVYSGGGS